MYYKILLIQLLLSTVICRQRLRNNVSTTVLERTTNKKNTSDTPNLSTRDLKMDTSGDSSTKDKVELTVYYETLCPASVNFFVTQLKPAVKRLGGHLDVNLIPYGHAKTFRSRGHYVFQCQHGHRECYGNRVHACAIDVLRNNTHSVLFNSCLMKYISYQSDYNYFVSVLSWCGYTEKVSIFDVSKCVSGSRGSILLKSYGEATHELNPSYVPYLVLDGSTDHQNDASYDLFATVCRSLNPKPSVCTRT